MPRRKWRPPNADSIAKNDEFYSCPVECPAHHRMQELFSLTTFDIVGEIRANKKKVPLAKQMVNGGQLRALIADFLGNVAEGIKTGTLTGQAANEYAKDKAAFIGLTLACLTDLPNVRLFFRSLFSTTYRRDFGDKRRTGTDRC